MTLETHSIKVTDHPLKDAISQNNMGHRGMHQTKMVQKIFTTVYVKIIGKTIRVIVRTNLFHNHSTNKPLAIRSKPICLNETTKSFMCLKSGLFPVFTLPNLAFKTFYVLIFSPKALCAYF